MFSKLPKIYLKTVEFICVVLLAVILLCICFQIGCRLLTIGQSFSEELSRICFCLMVFIASPLVLAEGTHIAVDLLFKSLPESVAKVVTVFDYLMVDVISVFCLIGFSKIIPKSVGISSVSMEWLKMNWIYCTILISFGMLFMVSTIQLVTVIIGKNPIYLINGDKKRDEALDIEVDI